MDYILQVSEYLVAAVSSDYINYVTIYASIEDQHVACGTKGSSGDILGFKAQVWAAELYGGLEGLIYHSGSFLPSRWRHEAG